MYNISFLEEMLEQERRIARVQAIREIEDIATEIINGATAYENALTVAFYERKYGCTEHFKLLVGEEGIFQKAKDAISGFLKWLKDKLITFFSKLFRVFRDIKSSLKMHFAPGADDPIKWKYDCSKVEMLWATVVGKICPITVQLDDSFNSEDIVKVPEQLKDEWIKGLASAKADITYKRREIYKHAININRDISSLSGVVGYYIKSLDQFQKEINDRTSMEDVVLKIEAISNNQYNMFIRPDIDQDAQSSSIIKGFVVVMTTTIKTIDLLADLLSSYITDLHKVYTKDGYSIHLTFPMDQSFVKRLSDYYGQPVRIRNMVVTNTKADLWPNPFNDHQTGLMGFCHVSDGSSTIDFYINVKVILSWFDRVFGAASASNRVSKIDQFLFVVVHECKHLFDSQTGGRFDMTKDYDEQDHEREANKAASAFQITDSDRAWAKKIIQSVEAEYSRQKQSR